MAKNRTIPPLWLLAPLWLGLAVVVSAPPLHAQAPAAPSGEPSASASTSASAAPTAAPSTSASASASEPPAPEDVDVAAIRRRTEQIRALLDGTLEEDIDPRTLFDVDLDDARALAVEIERLRRVLVEAAQDGATDVDAGEADAGADAGPAGAGAAGAGAADAGADKADAGATGGGAEGGGAEAGEGGGAADDAPDPVLLEARLGLDRARLTFYELTKEQRDALFVAHDEKRNKDSADQAKEDLSAAERERREAAADRARAEAEAKRADTEAKRLVAEERVRLLGVKESQASMAADLARDRIDLGGFDELLLSWQRPADEILAETPTKRPSTTQIDAVYDEIRTHLADIRTRLAAAIGSVSDPPESLARVGDNPLQTLSVDVDRKSIATLRDQLLTEEAKLLQEHEQQKWERMGHLFEAMEALDKRRLALIPLLSEDKRSRLQGFNPTAWDQAKREIRHLTLYVRYHLRRSMRFVTEVRTSGASGGSAFIATITALKWMLPIGLFVWWRRRAEEMLDALAKNAREAAKKARRGHRDETPIERAVRFYRRIRGPFEWLLLIWAVIALLPEAASHLLEVKLLWTALRWLLGGQLVVRAIDAFFAEDGKAARHSRMQTAHIRFRTLKLIGRVVVTFGLILAITSDLVGRGTIYSWVITANWIIAIPVALVIVRWWRDVIFQLVELQRKKNALLKWIERSNTGWQSFPAAVVGGAWLLGHNVVKFLRGRVLGIDAVKRLLAYWFRREVTKQSEARESQVQDGDLDDAAYAALDPEVTADELVVSVADEQVTDIIQRIRRPGGSVYAVVGERGAGKSTLLRRIGDKTPDTLLVKCPVDGIAGFHRALRDALGLPEDATDDAITQMLDKGTADNALLIDDAQHLVQPVVDGLEGVDRLLSLARQSSVSCTWVFAFDSIIWAYFSRAREVRPLFDDIIKLKPWSEEGIVRLLERRSGAAGIMPDFSRLVGDLPDDADEIDEIEALDRARSGYYRLLWDYSLGNPAVSLHFWRASLRVSSTGDHVVRLFDPPSTQDLERLPDSAVFVLRAIVQLDEASVADIAEATMLDRNQVEDAIRYALVRRYIEQIGDRVRVRWTWFRTITRFLSRRHLLVGPYQ